MACHRKRDRGFRNHGHPPDDTWPCCDSGDAAHAENPGGYDRQRRSVSPHLFHRGALYPDSEYRVKHAPFHRRLHQPLPVHGDRLRDQYHTGRCLCHPFPLGRRRGCRRDRGRTDRQHASSDAQAHAYRRAEPTSPAGFEAQGGLPCQYVPARHTVRAAEYHVRHIQYDRSDRCEFPRYGRGRLLGDDVKNRRNLLGGEQCAGCRYHQLCRSESRGGEDRPRQALREAGAHPQLFEQHLAQHPDYADGKASAASAD